MNMPRNERGFVLPGVIAMLTLVSLIATIKLSSSLDEHRSASSMQHSVTAFYAAEAGLAAVRDIWSDSTQTLDSLAWELAPGDSLVVTAGWQTLTGGGSYRASVRRVDAGIQRMYRVSVDGRDANESGGLLALSQLVTPAPSGEMMTFGDCCDAAVTLRGSARIRQGTDVDGTDVHPPGWSGSGVCTQPTQNVTGISAADVTQIDLESPSTVSGLPAMAEDTLMSDQTFNQYGDLDWEQIKSLANHHIGVPGSDGENYNWGGDPASGSMNYGPRYNPDGSCDTSHWLNFGSDDPTSTCYDYFPIIVIQGDVNLEDLAGYAQGLFILDVDAMGIGSELDLEGVRFNGVIIGKGCVEIQYGSQFSGAVFVDGTHFNAPLCDPDDAFDMNHYHEDGGPADPGTPAASVNYSSCAVQRVLQNTGLGIASGSGARGVVPIGSRAFEQPLY